MKETSKAYEEFMEQIKTCFYNNQFEEAIALLDDELVLHPRNYLAFMLKGSAQCLLGDRTGLFNLKFATDHLGTVESYLNLGLGYQSLKDIDGEETTYRKALELFPDDIRLMMNLMGIMLEYRKYYQEGYALGLKAYNLTPNSDACFGLAYASEQLNQIEEARQWYLKGLEFDDNSEMAYNDAAIFFESHGDTDLAYNIYLRGLDTYPTSALLYYNLGCWYVHNNQEDLALENYKKSFDLDEGFTQIFYDDSDQDIRRFAYSHLLEDWYYPPEDTDTNTSINTNTHTK